MIKALHFICVLVLVGMFCACGEKPEVYTADINPLSWTENEPVSVSFANDDTLSLRDISVIARYVKDADNSDIRFVMSTVTPSGTVWSDTVVISRDHGGQVSSDVWENEMAYRDKVLFEERGLYRMHFKPVGEVGGVYAIGVHILK